MLTTGDIYPIIICLYLLCIWNFFVVSATLKYKALVTLQRGSMVSEGVLQKNCMNRGGDNVCNKVEAVHHEDTHRIK